MVFGTSVFVSVEHFECSLAVVIQVDAVEALEFASAGDLVVRSIFEVVFEAYGHFFYGAECNATIDLTEGIVVIIDIRKGLPILSFIGIGTIDDIADGIERGERISVDSTETVCGSFGWLESFGQESHPFEQKAGIFFWVCSADVE